MGPRTSGGRPPGTSSTGWAAESLHRSLSTALLRGVAAWQGVMVGAVLADAEAAGARPGLVALHLAVAGLALWGVRHRALVPLVCLAVDGLVVVDHAVAEAVDGVLPLAAAWLGNLAHVLPTLLARGRTSWILSAAMAVGVPMAVASIHPDRAFSLAVPIFVTGMAIRWAGTIGAARLDAFAGQVDAEVAAAEQVRRRTAAARVAGREAAEQSRIIHDTVVNTLAAVASGGGATSDEALVRDRCRRDLETLDALLAGREVTQSLDLASLGEGLDVRVRRLGLDDESLARVIPPLLPTEFLALAAEAALLVSDSGGIQEEASVLKRPVLVVRRSTERPEALGTFAELIGPGQIGARAQWHLHGAGRGRDLSTVPSPFGDGTASEQIAALALGGTTPARETVGAGTVRPCGTSSTT